MITKIKMDFPIKWNLINWIHAYQKSIMMDYSNNVRNWCAISLHSIKPIKFINQVYIWNLKLIVTFQTNFDWFNRECRILFAYSIWYDYGLWSKCTYFINLLSSTYGNVHEYLSISLKHVTNLCHESNLIIL